MKTVALPTLRVDSELRAAAEAVLLKGETLSGFVLDAVRRNIERRATQREFLERGLAARGAARETGVHVEADEVLAALDATLVRERARQADQSR